MEISHAINAIELWPFFEHHVKQFIIFAAHSRIQRILEGSLNFPLVNVAGILGAIATEEKMVKGQPKQLLVLHLTDRYGKIEVRSWNHSDTEFIRFQEKPILLKRVRVCLYAGSRTGELLTGPHGSMITTDFDHSDLDKYWSE